MPAFSKASLTRLAECHPDLQTVMRAAITDCPVDFGITCGWRSKRAQDEACAQGLSKTPWPTSKHNRTLNNDGVSPCSHAVDVVPFRRGQPVWDGAAPEWRQIWDWVNAVAASKGIALRWGGDWDGDSLSRSQGDLDERFVDLPHIELK